MRTLLRTTLSVLVLLLAACSPPDDGGEGEGEGAGEGEGEGEGAGEGEGEGEGEGDALVTEDICADNARVVCAALDDCGCDPSLRAYADRDDCIAQRTASCASSLPPELVARLDAGTIRWVPALVDACAADLAALAATCRLVPTASCGTLFADPAPLDGTCQAGNEGGPCAAVTGVCADDLRCTPLPDVGDACQGRCRAGLLCVDGVCDRPGQQGGGCADSSACDPSLTCRDGSCRARSAVDGPCSATEHCAAGLACVDGTCAALPSRTEPCRNESDCGSLDACVRDPGARVCGEGHAVGDPCSFEDPCAPDLRCVGDRCVALPTVGENCSATYECAADASCDGTVCVSLPGLDEACLDSFPRCADGLGCNPTNSRCGAGGADGEPCHVTGHGDLCEDGLGCDFLPDGSICRPRSATGGPCTNDAVCAADDYCDFGALVCKPRLAALSPCAAGNECATGLVCELGPGGAACRPPPGPGDPCTFDCDGGAVCKGVGGVCQPQLCVVP